jgi:hypothetical protein
VKNDSGPDPDGPGEDGAVVAEDEAEIQLGKKGSFGGLAPHESLPMAVRDGDDGELQVGDAPESEADPHATRP